METWKAPGQGEQACVFIESSKVNILQCGSRCLERDMQGHFSNDVYGGEDTLLGAGTKNLHFCCICGAGMHGWGAG